MTPDIAAAWDEVYWLMADALIHIERGLYSGRAVKPQTIWRQWQVEQIVRETGNVVTFVVKRTDDRLVKPSLPGQYVTVQIPMPDGTRQPRQYSLSRADNACVRLRPVGRNAGTVPAAVAGRADSARRGLCSELSAARRPALSEPHG